MGLVDVRAANKNILRSFNSETGSSLQLEGCKEYYGGNTESKVWNNISWRKSSPTTGQKVEKSNTKS
jgi:hypothetical protein